MANEGTETPPVGTENPGEGEQGGQNPSSQQQAGEGSQEGQGQQQQSGGGERGIDSLPKWAQKEIRDARAEAAKYRNERNQREEQARREAMSEQERAIADAVSQAEQRANARLVRAETKRALAEANVINPKDSIKLLDLDELSVDDEGNVVGLDDQIKSLKQNYPMLVKGSGTNPDLGNRGNTQPKRTDMNDVLRRAAGVVQ